MIHVYMLVLSVWKIVYVYLYFYTFSKTYKYAVYYSVSKQGI